MCFEPSDWMKSRARRSNRPPIRRGRPIHRNSRHSRRAGLGNPRTPIIHKVTLRISTITFELTGFVSIYHMELAKLLYNLNSIARLFSVSISEHYVELGLVKNASNKTRHFHPPYFQYLSWDIIHWIGELEGPNTHGRSQQIAPLVTRVA